MKQIDLTYGGYGKLPARCKVTIFEPREIPDPLWPGCRVVILTEPPPPYIGLSVTNGAEKIVTRLLREHGIGLESNTVYIEHYTAQGFSEQQAKDCREPSFGALRFKWLVSACGPPYQLRPSLDLDKGYGWYSIPIQFYPILLNALGEAVPEWIIEKAIEETQAILNRA